MTWFLAASVIPRRGQREAFSIVDAEAPKGIELVDVSGWPIGRRVAGSQRSLAFLLNASGDGTDALGRGSPRRSRAAAVRDFLSSLVADYGGVALLLHFAEARLDKEQVVVEEHVRLDRAEFEQMFCLLRADVRYVVLG